MNIFLDYQVVLKVNFKGFSSLSYSSLLDLYTLKIHAISLKTFMGKTRKDDTY